MGGERVVLDEAPAMPRTVDHDDPRVHVTCIQMPDERLKAPLQRTRSVSGHNGDSVNECRSRARHAPRLGAVALPQQLKIPQRVERPIEHGWIPAHAGLPRCNSVFLQRPSSLKYSENASSRAIELDNLSCGTLESECTIEVDRIGSNTLGFK
jgi:hypothetical protein